MGKEFVYIRAVRILVPRKLVEAGRIYAIKRWAEKMGEIARDMEKHTGIKIISHSCDDYVFVLCRNDLEARLVYDFLQEKIGEEIDIAKAFPQISKEDYEKQLRQYNSESVALTRQKLQETQIRNEELERQIADLQMEIASLKAENEQQISMLAESYAQNESLEYLLETAEQADAKQGLNNSSIKENSYFEEKKANDTQKEVDVPNQEPFDETAEQIKKLKEKALQAQRILEETK